MENVLEYRVANHYGEYLCKETFTKQTKSIPYSARKVTPFDSVDDWIEFFGAYELRDEVYDDVEDWEAFLSQFVGEIDYKPSQDEYPVLITYHFEEDEDRFGAKGTQTWDWVSLSTLGLIPQTHPSL